MDTGQMDKVRVGTVHGSRGSPEQAPSLGARPRGDGPRVGDGQLLLRVGTVGVAGGDGGEQRHPHEVGAVHPQLAVARRHQVVRDEVRAVKRVKMAEDQITGEQHAQRQQHEENLQQNSYWASTIYLAYTSPRFSGDAQATHLEYEQARSSILDSLTPEKVRTAFNKIFVDDGTFTVASLVPLHPSRVRALILVTFASAALLAFKWLRR